jgi:hypothetical protein
VTTQQLLEEAIAARHALLVGKALVTVGYGERRMEYSAANLQALDAYIAELRRTLTGTKRVRTRVRYGVPD